MSTSDAVLLVEADAAERDRLGSALEGVGFRVVMCPGPTEPDYTCIGGRQGACPLIDDAAVVVLDMSLDSEALMMGTPAEELLGLYLTSGRRVVALGSRGGAAISGELVRLRRHADERSVIDAVRGLHPATRRSDEPGERWSPDPKGGTG